MPPPETTPDGHFIVVDGRRWRATDPGIPDPLRQELVDELMTGRRQRDHERVQAAKVALGERGEEWWAVDRPSPARLEATLLTLVRHRGPDRTICPSDVARAVGGSGWRSLMDDVRDIARRLARDGTVRVTQRGQALDPDAPWKGPLRIGSAAG